jgi:tetratricopeptide (TPR) repeat protein
LIVLRRIVIQLLIASWAQGWLACADCPATDDEPQPASRVGRQGRRGPRRSPADQRVPLLPSSGPLAQRVLHDQGRSLLLAGKPREAVAVLQRAIEAHPRGSLLARCYLGLGTALAQQGEVARAVEAYRQLVHLRPEDAEARRALALGLEQAGDRQAAGKELRRALALDGDLLVAYQDLAALLLEQGEAAGAQEVYQRYEARRKRLLEIVAGGGSGDEGLRAVQRLAEAPDERTARWLVDRLEQAPRQLQLAMIAALGRQRLPLAEEALRRLLESSTDVEQRRAIRLSLERIASRRAPPPAAGADAGTKR